MADGGKKAFGEKERGVKKLSRIPIAVEAAPKLPKPSWIRVRAAPSDSRFDEVKGLIASHQLVTVCQEAACPNRGECYGNGTAAFMIMGDKCTRRCPFCDVAHGYPDPLDIHEPALLADAVSRLGLSYVVLTSVNRDDLKDGGAGHYAACIRAIREKSPGAKVEILTPDFRGKIPQALDILEETPPDVFNHNLETVPRLYRQARPGADYAMSLALLREFSERCPGVPAKSGLMVGLGETDEEIIEVMADLRRNRVSMITVGQYLMPSKDHLPVRRYVTPDGFKKFEEAAKKMGFAHAAVGPLVRSSYHADLQAKKTGMV